MEVETVSGGGRFRRLVVARPPDKYPRYTFPSR